jgi:hypothetical protein
MNKKEKETEPNKKKQKIHGTEKEGSVQGPEQILFQILRSD